MKDDARWWILGLSTLLFVVPFGVLTGLRLWSLEPPTAVQSLIVNVSAVVIVGSVAYYAAKGGTFRGCWLLAFGPSLAFTCNLFVPVAAMDSLGWVFLPFASAAGLSLLLGGFGFLVGYVGSEIRREQNGTQAP
ncbi:hypothetical protein ACFQJC_16255 [Haloferax namakaokahaiae]|uniref:SPW repeat-containing protein n=1 Tax=Haloferax namakaokahaiae TaxID=1748331 RepID=A0ABD5ZJ00_9EURY